tara:strand:+ start:1735 stop:1917 length:183 start_codon:yes stop_codon:yes gene_type:complete
MLELVNTGKISIKALGLTLTSTSSQEELSKALALRPELKAYIQEIKTIKENAKKENTTKV